jgi:hypothetical protein
MKTLLKSILVEFVASQLLLGVAIAGTPGSLLIEPSGVSDNAYFVAEGKKFLLETSDEGLLFFRDGVQYKEPPLNVVAELYQKRFDEKEKKRTLAPRREVFLKNPRYRSLFVETDEKKLDSKLSVENGGVFEVAGGRKSKIVTVEGGRIVAEDVVTIDGQYWRSYRAVDPTVLAELLRRYGTSPKDYEAILANANNQKDIEWAKSRGQKLLEPVVAGPAKEQPALKTKSDKSEPPATAKTHSVAGSSAPKSAGVRPESPSVARTRSKVVFPSWVESASERSTYLDALQRNPDPVLRVASQDGLPVEYNGLRNSLDLMMVELNRMMEAGAPEKDEDALMEKQVRGADSLHRFWANYIQKKGGQDKLSAAEKARYEADLEDFEYLVIGFRYQKLYTEFLDKKIAEHEKNFGPPTSMWRNVGVSIKEDEALQEQAVRAMLKEFESNRVEYNETKSRLAALSKLSAHSSNGKVALKYPKLPLFMWQLEAKDLVNTAVGSLVPGKEK